jgi:Response regulator containing CheY-like receiver, AAA-type ATPase, and DNA-binding domains
MEEDFDGDTDKMPVGKRILIVDDEESVAFFLAENLAEQGPDYQVETASSGEEALAKITAQPFDLVITDLRMSGINGLELMERTRTLSPHTRLILMTAYGSPDVEATSYRLGACRYLAKPFPIQALFAAVQEALAKVQTPGRDILILPDERFDEIARCLADLRFELGAQCVLLADVTGQMLAQVGTVEGVDLQVLIALSGGSFAAAFELDRYLEEDQALTLHYHEGRRLDIYAANVNREIFLILLFDKHQQFSRIGMVCLYTRRTLQHLRTLIGHTDRASAGQVLDDDFRALLSAHLDQILAAPLPEGEPGRKSTATSQEPTLEEAFYLLQGETPDAHPPPPSPFETTATAPTPTFTLEQAIKMGLLDPSWEHGLDSGE